MASNRGDQGRPLVMAPQLQLALRLLGTAARDLPALIAEWQRDHPGSVTELPAGAADPYDELERALAAHEQRAPWFYFDEEPYPQRGADVWVVGEPPAARANGRGLPRLQAVFDDRAMTRSAVEVRQSTWLVRGLRHRARAFEQIVGAILGLGPALATAADPAAAEPVTASAVAEAVGMHESTVRRVMEVCRFQTAHGVVSCVPEGDALRFRRE